jgi:hypothetical protein
MTWIDQLPDAAATRAGNQHLAAVAAAAPHQPRLPGAEGGLIAWQQLPASKEAQA